MRFTKAGSEYLNRPLRSLEEAKREVAVGTGLSCVSESKPGLRRSAEVSTSLGRPAKAPGALTGKTAVNPGPSPLPNPTDTIMQVINDLREVQANV